LGVKVLKKRVFVLTGGPGSGKTIVVTKIVAALKMRGVRVGGMVSREAREREARVGFEIEDIASGKRGWLAHINQAVGPTVGKYRVNLRDLDSVGVQAITSGLSISNIVVIDEIGPMELFSENFKAATSKALKSDKLLIAVVHWKARDRLVLEAKTRDDAEVFVVTTENREELPKLLVERVFEFLKSV